MAKRKSIEGKDLMLFIDGKSIALATSCTLNLQRASNDSSSKDDGVWASDTPGDLSWNISSDNLYSASEGADAKQLAYDELFEAMVGSKDLQIVFGIASNKGADGLPEGGWLAPTSGGYTGVVHVTDLSLSGAKGSAASFSASFVGSGALKPQTAAQTTAVSEQGDNPDNTES